MVGSVRNWTGTKYTLSMAGGGGELAFVAIDHSDFVNGVAYPGFPMYKVDVHSFLSGVNDFCVISDYAFFCGYKKDIDPITFEVTYINYIGYFDMNELITGPTVHFSLMEIPMADILYRIEGFKDASGFKVYALGIMWDDIGGLNKYGIYEIDTPPTATNYSYTFLDAQLPLYGERMDEIVILEEEVVFTGRDNFHSGIGSPGAINMRKIDKTIGLNDIQINNLYLFQNPNQFEYNGTIHATYLGNNEFALSYTYTDVNNGISYNRIRVFDNQLNNINSQQYYLDDKLSLYDLVYNRGNETLTISEPWQGTSRFVFAKPYYTSGYTALFLYDSDMEYGSMDTISDKQFISSDTKHWLMQHANLLSYDPQTTANTCLPDGNIEVNIIPKILSIVPYHQLNVNNPNSSYNAHQNSTTNYILKYQCLSK